MQIGSQVYVGFDDFSLAGKHLLTHCHVQDMIACEPQKEDSTSSKWFKYMTFRHFKSVCTPLEESTSPNVTFVLIDTKAIQEQEEMWEFSTFLMDFFLTNKVQQLTLVGSLHLPFAKEHSQAYQVILYGQQQKTDGLSQNFDGNWEIKDEFLACMIHFIRMEQSIGSQLLLVKGFKPGPTNEGTKEAMEKLAKGLGTLSQNQFKFNLQKAFQTLETKSKEQQEIYEKQGLLYH